MKVWQKLGRHSWLRWIAVVAPGVVGLVVLWFLPPIPQDPAYHEFADTRTVLGIKNFGDVISNLAFILVGLYGLWVLVRSSAKSFYQKKEQISYWALFIGLVLTGLGSAWYHLNPTTETIFIDRLPMALVFMSLFSIVLSERISLRLGLILLGPAVLLGLASVIYWQQTEAIGQGDLRFYAWIQFCPMVAIPVILCLFPPRYNRANAFWWILVFYAVAKVCELVDKPVMSLTGAFSGHQLKHVVAAAAVYWIAWMLPRREPISIRN